MDDYRRRNLSSPRATTSPVKHDSSSAAAAHPPPLALSADRATTSSTSQPPPPAAPGAHHSDTSPDPDAKPLPVDAAAVSASDSATSASSNSPASVRRVAASVLFFCASSLGAIFVNKACLTHYNFNFPTSLMLLQAVLTIVLLLAVGKVRPALAPIVPIKTHDYRRLLPSTLFFVSNVMVGLSALSRVNIPMFSAFRRLTVLFVMGAEYLMLHKTHPRPVVLSVVVLTLGAFVSALGDVTFTLQGYMLVFVNNALTAAYLASIKRVMRDLQLDPISLLYYTNVLALPLIASLALFSRDLQTAYAFYYATPAVRDSAWFLPALSFVAVSAFCVNLSTSICTHVTSPLTTSVAGQVKNVLQSVLGFFSWGYVPTALNVAGLLVALGGQLAFAFYKQRDSKAAAGSGGKSPASVSVSATGVAAAGAGAGAGAGAAAESSHQHHRTRQRHHVASAAAKDGGGVGGVEREQLLGAAASGRDAL